MPQLDVSHLVGVLSLSNEGEAELIIGAVGGFFLGFLFAVIPIRAKAKAVAIASGPLIAIAALIAGRPEPNCDYECIGNAAWFLIVGAALAAWFGGSATGFLLRKAWRRRAAAAGADGAGAC